MIEVTPAQERAVRCLNAMRELMRTQLVVPAPDTSGWRLSAEGATVADVVSMLSVLEPSSAAADSDIFTACGVCGRETIYLISGRCVFCPEAPLTAPSELAVAAGDRVLGSHHFTQNSDGETRCVHCDVRYGSSKAEQGCRGNP